MIDLAIVKENLIKTISKPDPNADIEPQKPLVNQPQNIKAIYATSWSAGSAKKMNYFINLIKNTEANAIVIDIKDYTGYVSYETDIDMVKEYKTSERRISRPNALIKKLHDEDIYVIARVAVFQDLELAKVRQDLAIQSISTGKTWQDRKSQTWMDTSSKEVWDYNIAIAKDALARGFDEINFDYIRFASDGNVLDIKYPVWDGVTPKSEIIRQFFQYLRDQMPDARLSADLFGYSTVLYDDLGIGQIIENALPYFDAIAPMVYPSHYTNGHLGFQNPAEHPYEIVFDGVKTAINRLVAVGAPLRAKIRPWLQDFDLGADYDKEKVRAQIQATYDAAAEHPELVDGWMIWNAANVYTAEALNP